MGRRVFPLTVILPLLACAVLFAGSVQAALPPNSDNLQDLVTNHGTLTVGDKVFSNFDFTESGLVTFDASTIQVTASFNNGVYFLTWGGNMSLIGAGATADLLLSYKVTATNGVIDMIDQNYTGAAQGAGSHLVVDETAKDGNGVVVGNSHLDENDLSDPFAEAGDNLFIVPGQTVLNVTKDIALATGPDGGFVTITEVQQSFHQIPEAGTIALFTVGLSLLGGAALRRREAK